MSRSVNTTEKYAFEYNAFLDIHQPVALAPFEEWTEEDWSGFHAEASKIAAEIPYKIKELDQIYMQKHRRLEEYDDDEHFYALMEELNVISEKICALNVLFLRIEGRFIQTDRPH